METNKHTFASGLRLVHFNNTNCRSVTIMVCFGVGSNVETPQNNGISHFIEHMMFKGTKSRSAFDIVKDIESTGAAINAYTSKLMTCYYTKSVDEDAAYCMEILSDILTNSTFDKDELEKERKVILEEIAMSEDDNQDVCSEQAQAVFFGESPLARTILGPKENILKFQREDLIEFINNNYCSNNMVVAVGGNITFAEAKNLVEKYFEGKFKNIPGREWQDVPAQTHSDYIYKFKDIEQANISITFPTTSYEDRSCVRPLVYEIFAGGMSSRLFQVIREQLGLAYSVGCDGLIFCKNGISEIYIATNKESAKKAVKETRKLLDEILTNGFTEDEIKKGIKSVCARYSLGFENQTNYIRYMVRSEMIYGEMESIDDVVAKVKNITKEQADEYFRKVFDISAATVSYVGKEIKDNLYEVFHE